MSTKSSQTRPIINNNNNYKYDWDLIIGVKYKGDNKSMAFFKMNNYQYTKKLIQFVKHAMECNTIILPAVKAIIQDPQNNQLHPLFRSSCTCYRFFKYFEIENIVFGEYSAQISGEEVTEPCPCFLVPSLSSFYLQIPNFWSAAPHLPMFNQILKMQNMHQKVHTHIIICIIILKYHYYVFINSLTRFLENQ